MFYSQVILARKGPLGKIWLAAHWDKKLTKTQIFSTDITESVDKILSPTDPLALRVSGHLMLGIVRIYSRKVKYLMTDCTEAMWKIKMAFRPGNVDLPEAAIVAAAGSIDDARYFGAAQPDLDFPDLAETAFAQSMLTQYNELRAAHGKSASDGTDSQYYGGNENSVNYSDMNSAYGNTTGYGDDNMNSYYYYGGGLSPAIAMKSPGGEAPGSAESHGLKRKKGRMNDDTDSVTSTDGRMSSSGLLDIPDHLLGVSGRNSSIGRLSHISDVDLVRGEKHHRSTISEVARTSLAGNRGERSMSTRKSAGMQQEDDYIPAFDDNAADEFNQGMGMGEDYYGNHLDLPYENLEEPSNSDKSPLPRLSTASTASQKLSAILDEENQFLSGSGEYEEYPENQAEIQKQAELLEMQAEEKRRKRQLQLKKKNAEKIQKKNHKNSSNSIINQKTELTNAEIKGFLADTKPIMRNTRRSLKAGGVGGVGARQNRLEYHQKYFNQEDELDLMEPDQLFGLSGCRDLSDELADVYRMTMKHDQQPLAFPVEYVPREDVEVNTSTMSHNSHASRHTTPGSDVEYTRYGGEETGSAAVDNMLIPGGRLSGLGLEKSKGTPVGRYSEIGSLGGKSTNMFEDNEFNAGDTLDVSHQYDEPPFDFAQGQEDMGYQAPENDVEPLQEENVGDPNEIGKLEGEARDEDSTNPFMRSEEGGSSNEPNYEDIYGGTAVDVSTSTYHSDYYSHQMSTRTAKVLDVMKVQLEENESITFEDLTAGATRRTAAACFLEILQLKTWGYIDTAQKEPFDSIGIYATDRLYYDDNNSSTMSHATGTSTGAVSTNRKSSMMSYQTATETVGNPERSQILSQ